VTAPGVGGSAIGMGVDWIKLAQDSKTWRAVVKTVTKLRVP
jgi:hypothetical protein